MERIERTLLFKHAQSGDREAMTSILIHYRPLLIRLASKWRQYGWDDAMQEANMAAIEAVRMYDPTRGCYFGVFLRQRVRASLRTWGRRQVRWIQRHVAASSHTDRGENETLPIEEWMDDKSAVDVTAHHWRDWLHGLSPREKLVIHRHLLEGYPLVEIAEQEAVSPHTVQTWKKRAMKKLRKKGVMHV